MLRVQNMCREMGVLAVNKQRLGKRVSIQSLSQFVKIQTVNAVSANRAKGGVHNLYACKNANSHALIANMH